MFDHPLRRPKRDVSVHRDDVVDFHVKYRRRDVERSQSGAPHTAQRRDPAPGKPASGTWTQKDTGAKSTLVVGASGVPPPTWAASAGQATVQGSYSLTLVLASAAPTTSSSNGAIYAAHGTITAMLVPVATTSASGILTFSATF